MLKHPLLPVTACYAAGVALAAFIPLPLAATWIAALASLTLATFGKRTRPVWLGLALALTGAVNLAVHLRPLSPLDLRHLTSGEPVLATVRGRLETTPVQRLYGTNDAPSSRTLATLRVEAVLLDADWLPAQGRLVAGLPGVLDGGFFGGRRVEVYGVLRLPPGPRAPGLFNARRHYHWQGIHRQLETRATNDWRLAEGPQPERPALTDRFLAWGQRTLARGLPVVDEPVRLLWAMNLGWRTALTEEVSEPFMRTGTMHVFAISGLHIALIAGMLVALLRVLQVPRAVTGLGVVPLLWFYTAATGWQPSAVRATLMMTLVVGGWALQRPGNLLNSLAGSALLILLVDPAQLFQASFQLSFFVVLSMGLLCPPLIRLRDAWLRTDPFLPEDLVPRWRRAIDPALRYFSLSFVVSLAAWLGSLPLIALYFHLVSPVGLLVNVVIVPLASVALMANLGALVCGDWLPAFTGLFNHSAWFAMVLLTRLNAWAADLPGGWFHVAGPGLPAVAAWYAALAGFGSGWAGQPARRTACLLTTGILLAAFVAHALWLRAGNQIVVLPLRGGPAVWADTAGGANDLLVDAGGVFEADAITDPFLRAAGVNRLPHLALTHGDVRHVGGALFLEDGFRPRRIWVSTAPTRSPGYRAVLARPRASNDVLSRVTAGEVLAGWTVLHPGPDQVFPRADDNALVLWRNIEGVRVLLLSDLGPVGQADLLARHPALRADLVVTGLPAPGEALGGALLERLAPTVIVVADDTQPTSARATPRLRARLQRHDARVLHTADTGCLVLDFRAGRWEARDAEGRPVAAGGLARPADTGRTGPSP